MSSKFDHSGSSFDSFLEEEGIRDEVEATAAKRVIAWQLGQAMQAQQKSKLALAREMHTSRSQVERLLDPSNTAVSLGTIARAAGALGKKLTITLSDRGAPRFVRSKDKAGVVVRSGKRDQQRVRAKGKEVVPVRAGKKKRQRRKEAAYA